LPDVYVFRFDGSAPNPPLDDPNYDKVKREGALTADHADWPKLLRNEVARHSK